jgi:TolA-binding protein
MYGASIVISKQSFLRIADNEQFASRSVGKIQVKGKNQAVSVYEVFDGDKEKSFRLKQKTKKCFEKGLKYYQNKQFALASVEFNHIVECNPEDKAARLYLTRAAQCLVDGVPKNWNGVEVMSAK